MTVQSRGVVGLRGFVVLGTLAAAATLVAGCSKKEDKVVIEVTPPQGRPMVRVGTKKACKTFEGGKLSASWTDCPDKIRREVSCHVFVSDLTCDCLEDGVKKWFFSATNPPLETREDATRIANTNCHWGLE